MSAYIVCIECKVGARDDEGAATELFMYGHNGHGPFECVDETIFLSDHLNRGFIDTDRPALKPTPLLKQQGEPSFADPHRATPFGRPMSREALLDSHRRMMIQAQRSARLESPERGLFWRLRAFMRPVSVLLRRLVLSALKGRVTPQSPGD